MIKITEDGVNKTRELNNLDASWIQRFLQVNLGLLNAHLHHLILSDSKDPLGGPYLSFEYEIRPWFL